jgi:multidrug resistance efflux pump
MLFHHLLKPYGLAWLGDWIGVGALISMLLVPGMSFFTKQLTANRTAARSSRRPWVILGVVLLLAALLLQMPWQVYVERPAVMQPVNGEFVRAEVPGRLSEIRVKAGQQVKAGDVIAVLSNPSLTADVRTAELRLQRVQRELDLTIGSEAPAAFRQVQSQLAQAKLELDEAQRLTSRLTLRASRAGWVITPDLERLAAGSLRAGDALCEIVPLDPIQIFIPLNERQARYIQAGQSVDLRLPAVPERMFEGRVIEDRKTAPARELPPNLVATLGGDLAAQPDAEGRLKPLETTYGVLVSLPNADHSLRPGMTGTVRIRGPRQPLHRVLWMKLLDFISLDYRL